MTQKIQAEMSTDVALNTLKASQSLKSLNAVISSTKNAWKSQEIALKSTGEYLKAAEARYKGLGDSIKAQEAKIESLREKQKGLDVTTKDGAASYLKYQKNIDSATTQLKSMEAQQTRAKTSLEYQKSGLASLRTEYKQITTVSNAYVERLKAEGKQREANKAQMTGYKDSISNLNKQLSAQEKELSRIATASGKDSAAWRTQKVRVDETATALAKTKTSMTELGSAMKKANPSVFSRIKTAIEGANKQAEKTPSLFKKIVAGGLVTNAISNGFSTLTSSIKSTITSGLELDEAGEKINDTWKNMGKNANDIQILGDQMSYLRAQTGASGTEINTMQKSVDSFTHGVTEKTTVISAGIAGIATASHIGGSGMDTLAKSMQKVVASGDLTSGGLARLEKQAPTLGAQLAKAAGVSQGAFATMVAKGKISSADFQNLLYKIGTTSGDTFKAYGKTAEGAMAQIKGGWTSLKAKMAKPLLEVKNSGMASLSSLITSPVVQNAATSLGKGLAYIANMAKKGLDYISAHKKDVTGIASDLWDIAKIAGSYVWDTAKSIIKDIAGWLGVGGKNAKTMKDPLGTVHDILDKIVKNKSGIQTTVKVLAGLWATKKVFEFVGAVGHVYSGLKSLGESKLGQSIAGNLKKLSGSKLGTATAVVTIAYDAVSDIKDLTKAFGKNGTVGQKFKSVGETAGTAIGGGIGFFFGGPLGAAVGASIGKVVGGFGGKAAKQFMSGWGAQKKPANSWLGSLGWDAKKVLTPVTNGVKSMLKTLKPITSQVGKLFTNLWALVSTATSLTWKRIKPVVKTLGSFIKLTFRSVSKVVGPLWNALWKTAGVVLSNAWKLIKSILSNGLKVINDVLKVGVNLLRGNWSGAWSAIKKTLSGVWNGMKSIAKTGINAVYSVVRSVLGSIGSVWRGLWSGMKTFFSGIWSGIKSASRTGLNGVIGIINGAIGGINWVWQKFTGHNAIKKIQKLAQGGIVGNMHVVMVNDGAGPDWKELYQLPNGQYGMMQHRNALMMAPEGTRVWSGKETKSIMQMAGIQHYANGGIVGAVGNFFKAGWDKATAIGDWLKHPIANMTKAVESAVSGMTASTSMFTSLGKGIVSKMVSGVSAWAQKQLKKLEDTLSPAEPSGTGVRRWKSSVIKALKANGFEATSGQVAAWLRVIVRESNGNHRAINNWDSNAKAGHPSKGLVQTIDGTFNAYAFAGHKNIWNGYDDLLAGINYMKHIYGSGNSAFARVSGKEGYANGGLVNGAAYRLTGEAGPEMIVPLSASKASRAWQLLGQAVQQINASQSSAQTQIPAQDDNSDIIAAINALGVLMTKLSFNVQIGDDQFYPKVAPKVKAYNDRQNSFRAAWQD